MLDILDMLVKQSPWLLDAEKIQTDIHLHRLAQYPLIYQERDFLQYDFTDGVYIVTGPRQVGKSTHLKMLIRQYLTKNNHQQFLYFNCDLLDTKQDVVKVVETYMTTYADSAQRCFIMLDEITAVKDSFLAIKYLVDLGYLENITFILTGSNTISIKKTGEYLPGRRGKGIDFVFKPISFLDYLNLLHPKENFTLKLYGEEKKFITLSKEFDLAKKLDIYLKTGGFPRVINEYHLHGKINNDIFQLYRAWITSEIAKADKKEYIAKSILSRCLLSLGSDISYHAFAQDTGLGSHNTVYDYLEFFSSAQVLTLIYNYDISQKKINFKKNKKVYFNDPFIYTVLDAWLTGKPEQNYDFLNSPIIKSRLIENIVANKLLTANDELFFFKKLQEIDFITQKLAIEVKYQNQVSSTDTKLLKTLTHYQKIVVTKNSYHDQDTITFRPIEYFLLMDLNA